MNLEKSSIVGIEVELRDLSFFENMFGCKMEKWPFKYLGLTLGGSSRSISFRYPMVERVQKKLECWKKDYFSLGGQIILL